MDKKSKILFLVFGLLILASITVTYYRYMIKKDYVIEGQSDCDPMKEKCFVWKCDPNSSEEGEGCTGNSEEDISYFNVVTRNASRIPLCDSNSDESCDPWKCEEGEKDCEEILCSDEDLEKYGATECSEPEQYNTESSSKEENK